MTEGCYSSRHELFSLAALAEPGALDRSFPLDECALCPLD